MCVVLAVGPALAEPYLAVREGLPCAACHVNKNGGGLRTELAITHARDILRYPNYFGWFSNPPDYMSGEINKYVRLGGDLRVDEIATFQDLGSPTQCPGGAQSSTVCVDNNKVFRGRLQTNSLSVTEAVLYGEVRLIPEHLILYIDQAFQPSLVNREAFGLLQGELPYHINGWVKAGRFFLPYGLQLQDNGAFIRGGTNGSINTGFDFNTEQAGGEVGFDVGPFTALAAVTDGASGDRSAQFTETMYLLFPDLPVVRNVLLGQSYAYVSPPGTQSNIFGFFAGSNFERLTVLGEVDFREDRTPQTNGMTVGRFIAYGEGDYLFFGWLNFKAAINYSDNDGNIQDRTDDSENLVKFGLEPFLNRFFQPRLFYSISNGVKTQPTHNQNVLLFELHLFF